VDLFGMAMEHLLFEFSADFAEAFASTRLNK
jgi:hypothetical protein